MSSALNESVHPWPEEGPRKIVNIVDKCFGLIAGGSLALALVAYSLGDMGLPGLLSIAAFPVFHLLVSQITRAKGALLWVDLLRQFVGIPLVAVPPLLVVDGPLAPWWYGYLIMGIGARVATVFHKGGRVWIGRMTAYQIAVLVLAHSLMPDPNWYQVALYVVATIGLSELMAAFMRLAYKSRAISEEKSRGLEKALEELEEKQAMLYQKSRMSAIGEMAGGIAHEINNPLTVILGTVKLAAKELERSKLTEERMGVHLGTIERTVVRASKIINALRTISRGGPDLPISVAPLKDVLEDVQGLSCERMRLAGVLSSVEDKGGLLNRPLPYQRVQLTQALLNLVNNAFDAVQEEGAVGDKWIKIILEEERDRAHIKVMNSGPRISDGILDKIFTPFFTTRPVGKGTGLGLCLSKTMVEQQKGRLYVDTASAHTCFVIDLPSGAA